MLSLLATVTLSVASIALCFSLVAALACVRLSRRMASRPVYLERPPVVLLRPLSGDEPGLFENLVSSRLAYDGPLEVILLVPSRDDPSFEVASRAAAEDPTLRVVVTDVASASGGIAGLNRKSAQLTVGLEHALKIHGNAAGKAAVASGVLIAQADSDVRLIPGDLSALVETLGADLRLAAACAVPVDDDGSTLGDFAASAIVSATHQDLFVLTALAESIGGVVILSGGLAVHRLAPLLRDGGFDRLLDVLGEDFEIGRRLHARGLRVTIGPRTVRCVDAGRTMSTVLSRTRRWATVVRRQRPGLIFSYPMLLAPTPVVLALALASLIVGMWGLPLVIIACAAAALVFARSLTARWLRRMHGRPVGWSRAVAQVVVGEAVLLLGAVLALTTNEVEWRGRRLRIGHGGVIESAAPTKHSESTPKAPRPRQRDSIRRR